jgi:MFS transporter, DHA1 family, inner membrane transport protein
MLREPNALPRPAAGQRPQPFLTLGEAVLLLVLAAIQFTNIIDFMIVMPLGQWYSVEMNLTPGQFGNVVSSYTASAGIAALAASRFLDRFGRKAALLTMYFGFIVGTGLCAIAPNYWALLGARTVAGAFGGVAAAVVLAAVGDGFPMERRGMAMGVIMTAFSVASIVGIPAGLWIAELYGWRMPFFAVAGLGALVLIVAVVALPPLRGHMGHASGREIRTLDLIKNPNHIRAYLLMVSLVFASFTVAPYIPTFLTANVGMHKEHLLWMYLAGGVATLITLTYFGRLADRYGKLLVFRWLALATVVSVIAVTNLPSGLSLGWVLAATTFMFIATSGRMVPATALLTASAAPAERGGFMSVNAAVQHIAAGAAAWLGGMMLQQENPTAPLIGYPLVGIVSVTATLASMYLAGRLRAAPGGEIAAESSEVVAAAEAGAEVAAM